MRKWKIYIYRKDVYLTFCLGCAKLRNFITSTERQSNSRCLRGMFISFIALLRAIEILHIGVGF